MNTIPPDPGANPPGDQLPGDAGRPGPTGPVRWTGLVTVLGRIRLLLERTLAAVCIVTFVALVAIVSWQVFTRQVLGNSAPWTQEAANYTFVILAVFAGAYVFSERGHIAVAMLVEKLPLGGQKIMGLVTELIVIFFIVFVFIIGGSRVAENAWGQDLSTLPFTVGQLYLVLPIAGVMIVFFSLVHIIGILAGAEKPVPEFDENAEAI
ncbi:TRAP transporter small permease [Microbacterium sp. NPDC058021]|uniref:TRAP transporter small permease n=1 Tax=Microbacterium sp. NPDC058021 TaxID=3346306 RepID=UPI0036D818DF